ncbi:MAG: hypothetical protein WCC65_01480 [Pseudonocardiaceae bacterium]
MDYRPEYRLLLVPVRTLTGKLAPFRTVLVATTFPITDAARRGCE